METVAKSTSKVLLAVTVEKNAEQLHTRISGLHSRVSNLVEEMVGRHDDKKGSEPSPEPSGALNMAIVHIDRSTTMVEDIQSILNML